MSKMTGNFNEWAALSNFNEADLEAVYKRVKLRRNIYFVLSVFTPLGLILGQFWFRAAYMTKSIKYRDFDVQLLTIANIIWLLLFIGGGIIVPWILLVIIKRTNWGMGINGYVPQSLQDSE